MILLLGIMILLYGAVVWALIRMFMNFDNQSWLWLSALVVSLFLGCAPFVGIAYLVVSYGKSNKSIASSNNSKVVYNTDGSYVVYKSEDTSKAPSTGKVAFKVIVGVVSAALISTGLLIVGVVILLALKPPSGSKGM